MRQLAAFIIILFSAAAVLSAEPKSWYQPGDTLYVLAQSGLNLREKPGIDGKLVVKVPYGSKVTLQKDSGKPVPFVFENIKGAWVKAEFDGKQGYIFDGYLSSMPAPLQNGIKPALFREYLLSHFEVSGSPSESQEGDDAVLTHKKVTEFKNGITANVAVTVYNNKTPNFTREVYFFPNVYRIEEIFLLLKNLGYFHGDPNLLYPVSSQDANKAGMEIKTAEGELRLIEGGMYILIFTSADGVTLDIRNK